MIKKILNPYYSNKTLSRAEFKQIARQAACHALCDKECSLIRLYFGIPEKRSRSADRAATLPPDFDIQAAMKELVDRELDALLNKRNKR